MAEEKVSELLACPLCSMQLQAAADPRMSGMLEHPANAACPISACFFADTPELREAWNRRPTPVAEDVGEVEAALERTEHHRSQIQGFYLKEQGLHFIRDLTKPEGEQRLWWARSNDGSDYDLMHQRMMTRIEVERQRIILAALVAPTIKREG